VVTAAAHQVLFQVMMFGAFTLDGLAVAGQATVGTALGRGDRDEARALGRTTAALGAVGGALTALLLLVTAGIVPRLLATDPAVLDAVRRPGGSSPSGTCSRASCSRSTAS
jgi:Na+-driven multidrug efflux pump